MFNINNILDTNIGGKKYKKNKNKNKKKDNTSKNNKKINVDEEEPIKMPKNKNVESEDEVNENEIKDVENENETKDVEDENDEEQNGGKIKKYYGGNPFNINDVDDEYNRYVDESFKSYGGKDLPKIPTLNEKSKPLPLSPSKKIDNIKLPTPTPSNTVKNFDMNMESILSVKKKIDSILGIDSIIGNVVYAIIKAGASAGGNIIAQLFDIPFGFGGDEIAKIILASIVTLFYMGDILATQVEYIGGLIGYAGSFITKYPVFDGDIEKFEQKIETEIFSKAKDKIENDDKFVDLFISSSIKIMQLCAGIVAEWFSAFIPYDLGATAIVIKAVMKVFTFLGTTFKTITYSTIELAYQQFRGIYNKIPQKFRVLIDNRENFQSFIESNFDKVIDAMKKNKIVKSLITLDQITWIRKQIGVIVKSFYDALTFFIGSFYLCYKVATYKKILKGGNNKNYDFEIVLEHNVDLSFDFPLVFINKKKCLPDWDEPWMEKKLYWNQYRINTYLNMVKEDINNELKELDELEELLNNRANTFDKEYNKNPFRITPGKMEMAVEFNDEQTEYEYEPTQYKKKENDNPKTDIDKFADVLEKKNKQLKETSFSAEKQKSSEINKIIQQAKSAPFSIETEITQNPAKNMAVEAAPFFIETEITQNPAKNMAVEAAAAPFSIETEITQNPAKNMAVEAAPFSIETEITQNPAKTLEEFEY